MAASDIRAGAAYIELTLRDKVSRGLKDAADNLHQFGNAVAWQGAKIAAIGATITAPLVAMAHMSVDAMAELGTRMGREDVVAARTYMAALKALGDQLVRLRNAVASAVIPILTEQAQFITRLVTRMADWARANKETIQTVFQIGVAVVTAGVAIGFLGIAIAKVGSVLSVLATVVSGVGTAIGMLGTVFAALLSPIGLVVAAVVGLAAYFVYASGIGEQALNWLTAKFAELATEALASWSAIADALATGDIGLAAKIAWLTLKQEWQKGVAYINSIWLPAKHWFLSIWTDAFYGAASLFTDAWAGIEIAFTETVHFLRSAWSNYSTWMAKTANSAIGLIQKGWVKLKAMFDETINVDAEFQNIDTVTNALNTEADQKATAAKAERDAQRQARRDQIEKDRQGTHDELANRQAADMAARQAQHDADVAGINNELQKTKDELAAARQQAHDQKAAMDANRPQLGAIDMGIGAEMQKLEGKGTFNAMAVRGLGADSLAERTAKASEDVAKNTKGILEAWNRGVLAFQP